MAEILYNGVEARLAARMTASSELMVITNSDSFPTDPEFRVRINDELLLVTSVNGSSSVVARGIEGTTPAVHEAGSVVFVVATKGSLEAIRAQPISDANYLLFKSGNQVINARLSLSLLSTSHTYALPNKSGTVALLSDIQQVSVGPATETIIGGVMVPSDSGLLIDPDGKLSSKIKSIAGKSDENIVLEASDIGAIPVSDIGKGGGVSGPLSQVQTGSNARQQRYLGGKIPLIQIPLNYSRFEGNWNADTNVITYVEDGVTYTRTLLANGQIRESWPGGNFTATGVGTIYRVSVAGNTALDGLGNWEVGQLVYSTGVRWEKLVDRSIDSKVANAVLEASGAASTAVQASLDAASAIQTANQAALAAASAEISAVESLQETAALRSSLESVVNTTSILTTPFIVNQTYEHRYIRHSGSSSFSATLPLDTTEPIVIGFSMSIRQVSSGVASINPVAGVTVLGPTSTSGSGSLLMIRKVEINTWESNLVSA